MLPTDMNDELQAWNNGAGVSLETWVSCMGNMKLAVAYSTLFWPRFKVLEDYVVRVRWPRETGQGGSLSPNQKYDPVNVHETTSA
jgi:hypothetical protein